MAHTAFASVKLPSPLVEQARQAAQPMRRSVASQIEYWATLGQIVEHTGLSVQEVKALNPGYLRNSTPSQGPHHLLVPKKSAQELELALNELPTNRRLKPGEQFVLPGEEEREQLASRRSKSSGERQVRYTQYKVKPGDSLWTIGKAYGVTQAQILSWNKLPHNKLKVGQTLKLQASAQSTSNKRKNYEVRRGDSLYSIAQRFQISVDDLVRWNQISHKASLKPGQTLIVKG